MNGLADLVLENPCIFRAKLTSRFTDERGYGCHGGIDLAPRSRLDVPYLRPVYPGVVDQVGIDNRTGMGRYCVIRSEHGGVRFYQWYMHLRECYLYAGMEPGVLWMLGIAGETGNATGIHLHLALQVPGYGRAGCGLPSVIDPLPFFSAEQIEDWS